MSIPPPTPLNVPLTHTASVTSTLLRQGDAPSEADEAGQVEHVRRLPGHRLMGVLNLTARSARGRAALGVVIGEGCRRWRGAKR